MTTVLVAGGAGFIGNHLVRYLKQRGDQVRVADIQYPPFGDSLADEFMLLDLRDFNNCLRATRGVQHVYDLAADVGGLGYIHDGNHARIMRTNLLINVNIIEAARMQGAERYLFTSSAVVYPQYLQTRPDVTALAEDNVMPADPAEEGYGWQKLIHEQLCRYYHNEERLDTRVARLHNSYGPMGAYDGGKEKAPAALCRKVAESRRSGSPIIDIWGDGTQTRSFTYVDDTIEGIDRLMQSDHHAPLNIGSSELVTINQMVDIIADIAGTPVEKRYLLDQPVGVAGRNSDNTRVRDVLGWEPSTSLADGLRPTYAWISQQVMKRSKVSACR